jgi:hypothetical protein
VIQNQQSAVRRDVPRDVNLPACWPEIFQFDARQLFSWRPRTHPSTSYGERGAMGEEYRHRAPR